MGAARGGNAVKERELLLWTGVLAGPVIWFASLLAGFALAPWACTFGWKPAMYAVSAAALALAAAAGLLAHRQWHQLGRADAGEAGGILPSARALAAGGMALSALFFLTILAQAITEFILGACE